MILKNLVYSFSSPPKLLYMCYFAFPGYLAIIIFSQIPVFPAVWNFHFSETPPNLWAVFQARVSCQNWTKVFGIRVYIAPMQCSGSRDTTKSDLRAVVKFAAPFRSAFWFCFLVINPPKESMLLFLINRCLEINIVFLHAEIILHSPKHNSSRLYF